MTKTYILPLTVLTILLFSCSTVKESSRTVPENPVFHLANYDFDPESSLHDRVGPVPDHVLTYLEDLDDADYSNYDPTENELQMINDYLDLLPPLHKEVLQRRLVGIYFLEPFLGGGLSEYVLSEEDEIHAFIVFNAETLHQDLSTWITYRENTAFEPEEGWKIESDCGTEYTAFIHILLHEATHVVDFEYGITPELRGFIPSIDGEREEPGIPYEFSEDIWNGFTDVKRKYDFDSRAGIAFYGLHGGPFLKASEADRVYRALADSPFVSLYGATTSAEDLAELAAWYHINGKLGQPNRIICTRPGKEKLIFDFEPDPVTEDRRAVLQWFYDSDALN